MIVKGEMYSNSGLGLLAESYVSSSDEDGEHQKRNCVDEEDTGEVKRIKREEPAEDNTIEENFSSLQKTENNVRLPIPSSISTMFCDQVENHEDDPTQHRGKIRTFKHEAGNWASFVYVSYEPKDSFCTLVKSILKICSTNDVILEKVEDLHLSVSKTVVIRHHWIKSLTTELQKKFTHFNKFLVCLKSLDIYTNDEKTRTFIGMKAHAGYSHLKSAVDLVDECFAEFKLPPFYKPPSFHVSIAWCNGDYYHKLTKLIPHLQEICEDFVQKRGECRNILVDKFKFKTGNNIYTIGLRK